MACVVAIVALIETRGLIVLGVCFDRRLFKVFKVKAYTCCWEDSICERRRRHAKWGCTHIVYTSGVSIYNIL